MQENTETSKPAGKLGGWGVALIFLVLLVVLIAANMF